MDSPRADFWTDGFSERLPAPLARSERLELFLERACPKKGFGTFRLHELPRGSGPCKLLLLCPCQWESKEKGELGKPPRRVL